MNTHPILLSAALLSCAVAASAQVALPVANTNDATILTPPAPPAPRINGARVYGQRPGRPFLFTIPATGAEPLTYSATGLPQGLVLDPKTGRITGSVARAGTYRVRLTASNALGRDSKGLRIEIGDRVSLTPPMGWNTYNALGNGATQEQVLRQADAMAQMGLVKHGWTYINIDDAWQGTRGGPNLAMQSNASYPDMKALTDHIHGLGLKAGIYSSPWVTSYGGNPGASSTDATGAWTAPTSRANFDGKTLPWAIGPVHFMKQDAKQWADWGFDYLKYDWFPNDTPETQEMTEALQGSGRDFVFSLSNTAPFEKAADWARLSNLWRTTGDIRDTWPSMTGNLFAQEKWAPFAGPGHWNDPDMLVIGVTGGWANGGASKPGPTDLHPSRLSPDEQYSHISLWSLSAAPLLLGCDLTKLDAFTLGLITNDEVIAIDQDPLGQQARRLKTDPMTGTEVWSRPLADGTLAVGLFNVGRYELTSPRRPRAGQPAPPQIWRVLDKATGQTSEYPSAAEARAEMDKGAAPVAATASWADLKLNGSQPVRDVWRQQDLGASQGQVTASVPLHGVVLLKIGTPRPID